MDFSTIRHRFEDKSIYDAPDDELKEILGWLASEGIVNDRVRHTAEIQAMAILQIQHQRALHALEKDRKMTERWFMVLAIGSIVIGAIGLFLQALSVALELGVLGR